MAIVDPTAFLATIAQSSAAIVAIVGGFLVSRLVALSSERDGLRRQLIKARDSLAHLSDDYARAHDYRLSNSKADFYGWVIDTIVENRSELDVEAFLDENIPRGSSIEEMRPYLLELIDRTERIEAHVRTYIRDGDTNDLNLENLVERGLSINSEDEELYEQVSYWVISQDLPARPRSRYDLGFVTPNLRNLAVVAGDQVTTNRRLDESIRHEQDLRGQMHSFESEVRRLVAEIASLGRPSGVNSAILILSAYSLLGIVVPVTFLAIDPKPLSTVWVLLLILLFVIGLFAVLAYMWWYARTLDDDLEASE